MLAVISHLTIIASGGYSGLKLGNLLLPKRILLRLQSSLATRSKPSLNHYKFLQLSHQNWLLILDKADDPDVDYRIYFPPGEHGAVLMTSRDVSSISYSPEAFEVLEVPIEQHSQTKFHKSAELVRELGLSDAGDETKEAVHLQGLHPLTFIQGGAYIGRGHCQLYQYPEEDDGTECDS